MARRKATLLRRSGVAVYNVARLLNWEPTFILQAGLGKHSQEVDVFREAWPEAGLLTFEPRASSRERSVFCGTLLVPKALGNRHGVAELFFDPAHVDGASLYRDPQNKRLQSIAVEVTTLDTYYQNIVWIEPEDQVLLWLDCEGSELDVLKGGEEFVEGVDVVNVELTGKALRPGWPSPVEVNRWLLDHGFVLQFLHTQRMDSGQCDAVYVRPKLFKPEYCPCPLTVENWGKE